MRGCRTDGGGQITDIVTSPCPLIEGEIKIRMKEVQSNNYNLYNKNLRSLANKNRKQMTKAEACLWKYVLKAKMTGYTFNRQRPILNYIADFMCKELMLIIEIDGYTHLLDDVIKNDARRQQNLEAEGFKIIRFKDEEVLKDINRVRDVILKTLEELSSSSRN